MTALLIVLVIMGVGTAVARGAWVRLSHQEHDVLHTHPKLVVALIVATSVILSVQTVQANFVVHLVDTVDRAVDPNSDAAKQQIVVVADIEDVSIAAAACAQGNEGVDAIRSCVIEQVETRHGAPPLLTARPTTTTTRGG